MLQIGLNRANSKLRNLKSISCYSCMNVSAPSIRKWFSVQASEGDTPETPSVSFSHAPSSTEANADLVEVHAFTQTKTGQKREQLMFPWRGKGEEGLEYKSLFSVFSLPSSSSSCPMFTTRQNENRGFFENLVCSLRGKLSEFIIYHLFVTAQQSESSMMRNTPNAYDYMDPRGGGLLTGAQQAFTACSNSIFALTPVRADTKGKAEMEAVEEIKKKQIIGDTERIQLELLKSQHGNEEKARRFVEKMKREEENLRQYKEEKAKNRAFSPPLSEVVEGRLAQFFQEAFERLPSPLGVHYTLHSTRMPSLAFSDVLFNAFRGPNYDFLQRLPKLYDLFYVQSIRLSDNHIQAQSEIEDGEKVSETERVKMKDAVHVLKSMQGSVTIRVTLDIPCSETFFIKNTETQDIIQGSEQPVERTHQLLLEAVHDLAMAPTPDNLNWTVVDIDNWLGGNEFWLIDRKVENPLADSIKKQTSSTK